MWCDPANAPPKTSRTSERLVSSVSLCAAGGGALSCAPCSCCCMLDHLAALSQSNVNGRKQKRFQAPAAHFSLRTSADTESKRWPRHGHSPRGSTVTAKVAPAHQHARGPQLGPPSARTTSAPGGHRSHPLGEPLSFLAHDTARCQTQVAPFHLFARSRAELKPPPPPSTSARGGQSGQWAGGRRARRRCFHLDMHKKVVRSQFQLITGPAHASQRPLEESFRTRPAGCQWPSGGVNKGRARRASTPSAELLQTPWDQNLYESQVAGCLFERGDGNSKLVLSLAGLLSASMS